MAQVRDSKVLASYDLSNIAAERNKLVTLALLNHKTPLLINKNTNGTGMGDLTCTASAFRRCFSLTWYHFIIKKIPF